MKTSCTCIAYNWPHSKGLAKCLFNPLESEPRCLACGKVCKWTSDKLEPEEPGYPGFSEPMSTCCDAEVVQDGEILTSSTS